MLQNNMNGYLINNKQIIAFAKWYLNNPLATKTSSIICQPYNNKDIKNVHNIIKEAKKNSDLVAFRKGTYDSVLNTDMPTGLHVAHYQPRKSRDVNTSEISTTEYLKFLKKQILVDWKYVVKYAKAVNKKSIHNAKKIDNMIKNVVHHSDTRIQYKKFLNNKFNLDSIYNEFSRGLLGCGERDIDYDILNSLILYKSHLVSLYRYDRHYATITPETFMKKHNTKPDKVKANIYDKIAFLAYLKWNLPYINLNSYKHTLYFKSDVNVNHLCKDTNNANLVLHEQKINPQLNYITDPHKLIDYKHFVKKDA